jgi:acetyltransferase
MLSTSTMLAGSPFRFRTVASWTSAIGSELEPAKDYTRVQLNDARLVNIRPIVASDLPALRAFFAALSGATRRLRFHSSTNEISEPLLREFTMINHRTLAFVAETHDGAVDQPATIVAEARYVRTADSESAEFALVVADNWRRIGLGTTLTRVLAQCARFAGVLRLCGDVLEDNKAMRGLARSLGARLSRGTGCLRVSLEA